MIDEHVRIGCRCHGESPQQTNALVTGYDGGNALKQKSSDITTCMRILWHPLRRAPGKSDEGSYYTYRIPLSPKRRRMTSIASGLLSISTKRRSSAAATAPVVPLPA